MRVIHVYKDYAPVIGGIENHIRRLVEGLRARGVDARVLVTNTEARTVSDMVRGVPVTRCARIGRASAQADLVHLHLPYPPGELAQWLFGRCPYVVTYHSDIVRQRWLGRLYRPFARRVLAQARRITVSNPNYIRSSPLLAPLAGKCVLIHHGLDLEQYEATPAIRERAAQLRTAHGPFVLAVGRHRHYKGFDVLVRALAGIPTARAVIVGDGPLREPWERLAGDLGLGGRIYFSGELDQADLLAHYFAADLFVLPSTNRAESWGSVLIEAMACGRPLISTELGTGTSYVNVHGVTGLVIPPGDPAALARAIGELLAAPERREAMGAAGKKRAQEEFSAERMVRDMLEFYGL